MVDQSLFERGLAAHALATRRERVGHVTADVSFLDDAREAAGAGQHGQQRDLGEGDRRGPVVDQQDLVTGERELVATARRCAVHRSDPGLARVGTRVLDRVAGLVGELAEVDLVAVAGPGQHLDVGAGAEDLVEPAGHDDRLDPRVLEPQPLSQVVELDVDAQVIGVGLEVVVLAQPTFRVDRHRHGRHRTVDVERPVPVAARIDGEVHHWFAHVAPLGSWACRDSTFSSVFVNMM